MRPESDGSNKNSAGAHAAQNGSSAQSPKVAVPNGTNGLANGRIGSPNPTPPLSQTVVGVGNHDREEIARLIMQGLIDLGYSNTARALSQESSYELESPHVFAFKEAIKNGDWVCAEALLTGDRLPSNADVHDGSEPSASTSNSENGTSRKPKLPLSHGATENEMLFLIRQQKYLELLEARDLNTALVVLREELQPLHQGEKQLHFLSWSVDIVLDRSDLC